MLRELVSACLYLFAACAVFAMLPTMVICAGARNRAGMAVLLLLDAAAAVVFIALAVHVGGGWG